MTVVFDRPYQFVPPHRGVLWPLFIQKLRLVDWYLRRKEGIVSWECRGLEHLKRSLERGDGILLAPNHCRYADPLVLGWPARLLKTNVYAMASWHLFNQGKFDGFAIQKMGGFSIHREGVDRQALETAIASLATAERPLVLFPEGTTNRSNDVLKPLLDGVSFIARSAARRRKKKSNGNVVIHPIAIKYLCVDDICDWARQRLLQIEQGFGWRTPSGLSIAQRTRRIVDGAFALREVEYLGTTGSGTKKQRLEALITSILQRIETRLAMQPGQENSRERVRAIRTEIASQFFQQNVDQKSEIQFRQDVIAVDMVQDMISYPESYLDSDEVTDSRIVETIQRMEESICGKADCGVPLRAVIQIGDAINVQAEKAPRGEVDPLMLELKTQLDGMLTQLACEARPFADF
ncbi:MAG TPA: 1-acyl-sn-glycerol-3-phosphate acyltransferase [Rhodopirellula sp.]|nr:MAG: 1-acyl-sn-glycerol-3-phosphate acyltransferase [Saprospirales bacterium TMED214]HBV62550.1 1-acyl-sn-glycerol-3-phosphate acyltransferase [Rhodopirellula sp.]